MLAFRTAGSALALWLLPSTARPATCMAHEHSDAPRLLAPTHEQHTRYTGHTGEDQSNAHARPHFLLTLKSLPPTCTPMQALMTRQHLLEALQEAGHHGLGLRGRARRLQLRTDARGLGAVGLEVDEGGDAAGRAWACVFSRQENAMRRRHVQVQLWKGSLAHCW